MLYLQLQKLLQKNAITVNEMKQSPDVEKTDFKEKKFLPKKKQFIMAEEKYVQTSRPIQTSSIFWCTAAKLNCTSKIVNLI